MHIQSYELNGTLLVLHFEERGRNWKLYASMRLGQQSGVMFAIAIKRIMKHNRLGRVYRKCTFGELFDILIEDEIDLEVPPEAQRILETFQIKEVPNVLKLVR